METGIVDPPNIEKNEGLNRTMQYGNFAPVPDGKVYVVEFKSYYVVWKREPRSDNSNSNRSLNRTMQYGNPISFTSRGVAGVFKSYYVVWKR